MKVLVVGAGGREHSLCWAIAASPLVEKLYCAPGNAGIAWDAECVPIAADDVDGLVAFATGNSIDFAIIGPEAPLVAGIVNQLVDHGIRAFGPSAKAAMLEGSKGFMKDFCARHSIPTAAYRRFTDLPMALEFIRQHGAPIVVKADGLAAGKGVIIAQTVQEAEQAARDMLEGGRFGEAGSELVIEEFMAGEEASFFVIADGKSGLALASAQDHKRVGDGDTGPNTGGMGAYSPAPVMTNVLAEEVMATIIDPTIRGMAMEGNPYTGVLYAGLMIDENGPRLLEFNARFGDPECQVLMVRLASDLLPALIAACDGVLKNFDLRWHDDAAMCVVMAANGYPGAYDKGSVISGLDNAAALDGVNLFHAGTVEKDGNIIATGGRVLNVTATGRDVAAAQKRVYQAVDLIDWPGGFCRRDIGWRAVGRD